MTRFAPSPTGHLHLGHARAALFAYLLAMRLDGVFLLRFEDIDPVRCRPDFEAAALEDLAWLGLTWKTPVRRQSDHPGDYQRALAALRARGLLYPCFCTRADIVRDIEDSVHAPHGTLPGGGARDPDGGHIYPGTCRGLGERERTDRIAAGAPHAWRLDVAQAAEVAGALAWRDVSGRQHPCDARAFGDVVLARKDVATSYHLAVTSDDAATGVTLVTRGADLMAPTAIHRLLQVLLGWPAPSYAFHPLMLGPDGRRLAKRDGARTLAAFRGEGVQPADIVRLTGASALVEQALRSRA